jgi:hypothetical protein
MPSLATKYCTVLLISLVFYACKRPSANQPRLFELVEHTGIRFENTVTDEKKENSFLFRNFYNGGGVGLGDINNDGLADVFLTSNMGENKLYLNTGNFQFKDITQSAGCKQDSMWSTGVLMVDVNSDGWLDIYVCNSGHMTNGNRLNKLYINNHDLTFTESAKKFGLQHKGYSTQVSFFDYDLDGDLDCFIIDNSPIPVNQLGYNNKRDLPQEKWNVGEFLKGGGNHLYRNDNNYFTDVTTQSGIHSSLISFGLGVSVGDVNQDGYPDIYVSNDSYERDYLYINQKNGLFKDEFEDRILHTSFSSMGSDLADINNDGLPDIFNTDMLPDNDYRLKTTGAFDNIDLFNTKLSTGFYYQYVKNCLQVNTRGGHFIETGNYSGISASDWSWGALMFDMDNDGMNDIYVSNGVNRDVTDLDFIEFFANDVIQKMVLTGEKQEVNEVLKHIPQNPLVNKVYHNLGNLKFEDKAISWGMHQPTFSNGAAYGDLDNDGDLDLIVNNENQPTFVYKNNSRQINRYHYIGLHLKGTEKNTFAIGTKVDIFRGNEIITRELYPCRGFQSSVDYKQIIGLGENTKIDSMVITWPDLSISSYEHPLIDTVVTIQQPARGTGARKWQMPVAPTPILKVVAHSFDKHTEDGNIDFYYERNLPKLLSREGPKATVGDINGDGREDICIGGAANQPTQVYLQQANGRYEKMKQPSLDLYKDFEDVTLLLLDSEKDGDLDLLICPGGNNAQPITRTMQLRLFRNNGKGNFEIDVNAFPTAGMNIGTAAAYDFTGDGYPDVFIGGRSDPRNYGVDPESYCLVNNGKGQFVKLAPEKCEAIAKIGMVTAAEWVNISGDAQKELVIVGEWMAPRIFSYTQQGFVEVATNLSNLFGWWESMAAADLNGDGLTDLVLGNIGENFYLRPDTDHPIKLWLNDFDQNNASDRILTSTIDGKDMPVFMKHEMEDQLPSLKKKNLKHRDYAEKSFQELFSAAIVKSCKVKTFNYGSSIIAYNLGNGKFSIQKLPVPVQLSSVNALLCTDINQDNFPDILLGGNEFGFLPQFDRLDAGRGALLLNNGKSGWQYLPSDQSGLNIKGQIRDIKEIIKGTNRQWIFLRNDDVPVLIRMENTLSVKTALSARK